MKSRHAIAATALLGILGASFLLSAGCRSKTTVAQVEAQSESDDQVADADESLALATQTESGGAQLWADNCMRCHNYRQPRERSDREWEAIVHHMRVRANLPGQQARLILRFLKSAN